MVNIHNITILLKTLSQFYHDFSLYFLSYTKDYYFRKPFQIQFTSNLMFIIILFLFSFLYEHTHCLSRNGGEDQNINECIQRVGCITISSQISRLSSIQITMPSFIAVSPIPTIQLYFYEVRIIGG